MGRVALPESIPDETTMGEKYNPAMEIEDQVIADEYFEMLVEHNMRISDNSRLEAENIERSNLGYIAGYYDHETRLRVEKLFVCRHPMLGKASDEKPTPEEAFEMGQQWATREKTKHIVNANGEWFNDGKGK